MKKCNLLILCLLCMAGIAYAQTDGPLNPQKDKLQYKGYTIKLIPADAGQIGYDIFEGERLVVHQSLNPFTMAPVGLSKKADAYKAAQWQIEQLKKELVLPHHRQGNEPAPGSGQPPLPPEAGRPGATLYNPAIPMSVAKELNISIY